MQTSIHAWHYGTRQPVQLDCDLGQITALTPATTAPAENVWLAPTLVDLQVNGYGGVDFQQDNLRAEDLLSAVRQLHAAGVGRFLLTLVTDEWPRLTARFRHLKKLRDTSPELRFAIAGWHIEGPFLSSEPGFCGAHDPALMLDPTPEKIRELAGIAARDPLLLTLAPERTGALEAIALAASLGGVISLGHTDASSEILKHAVEAGASAFTHLGNGCPRTLDRHDNILWRVLETPGLTVSLIPDGLHLSPAPFRLLHQLLDSTKIFYTTDAMSAAGAGPGSYSLGRLKVEVGADQVVRQPGRTNFAGSALRPIDGVLRAAQMLGCPWQKVWRRYSETPAKLMGLRSELRVGGPANFCLLTFGAGGAFQRCEAYPAGVRGEGVMAAPPGRAGPGASGVE